MKKISRRSFLAVAGAATAAAALTACGGSSSSTASSAAGSTAASAAGDAAAAALPHGQGGRTAGTHHPRRGQGLIALIFELIDPLLRGSRLGQLAPLHINLCIGSGQTGSEPCLRLAGVADARLI